MLIKIALKNLLGARLRTILNIFVTAFSFFIILLMSGIYDGMLQHAKNVTINTEIAGGAYWHPNYDPLDPISFENAHSIVPNEIKLLVEKKSKELDLHCVFFQNNNEGELISHIQSTQTKYDGLIINPAAFTHTSVALLDALRAVNKPKIEIHLSNIYTREEYRKKSITSEGVDGLICGFGHLSYILAIEAIKKLIYKK